MHRNLGLIVKAEALRSLVTVVALGCAVEVWMNRRHTVNSAKAVTGIPVNYVFLQYGSKSQITDINLRSLSEYDEFIS